MVICYLKYVLNPQKPNEFKICGKMWIPLLGNSLAFITVTSCPMRDPATAAADSERQAPMKYYEERQCFLSYERSFMRPAFR